MNLDFSNLRILVYGDVMLDEYVHGVIERISPEAPVPVLSRTHSEYRPGGAANVAANVAALGAEVALCGVVADDDAYHRLLTAIGHEVLGVVVCAADRTTVKTRYLGQRNHNVLRVDTDGRVIDEPAVIATIDNRGRDFDAIIVSDYAKGAVTKRAMDALRAKGVPIFVDPKQKDWSLYDGASWFTPNESEYDNAGLPNPKDCRGVLVTLGARGMCLLRGFHETSSCYAVAQSVADVTGAGDTVIAAFACAITGGNDPIDAMRFANAAAGVAVSKSGTVTVSIAEAREAFADEHHGGRLYDAA